MKILITGANGLLGQALVQLCQERKLDFIATSREVNRNSNCPQRDYSTLDITKPHQVLQVLDLHNPTHIINTAAMTNVDSCEAIPEECHLLNVKSVSYLFEWCKKNNAHLQQISTDFVFDGVTGSYDEKAQTNPLSEYGKSKLLAEKILLKDSYKQKSIIRTSVVYGRGENMSKSNIVLWAIDALKAKKKLTIVSDQYRTPTWSVDLARGCLGVIENSKTGIYHIAGPVEKSIYAFILEIADFLNVSPGLVTAISTETLNQTAERPLKSGLMCSKANDEISYKATLFKETLYKL